MTGMRYSPLHVTEFCGEMQGKFKVGRARLNRNNSKNSKNSSTFSRDKYCTTQECDKTTIPHYSISVLLSAKWSRKCQTFSSKTGCCRFKEILIITNVVI